MPEHENSSDHQRAFKGWKMSEITLNKGKIFDSKLQELWRLVLTQLLDVTKEKLLLGVIEKMNIVSIKVTL